MEYFDGVVFGGYGHVPSCPAWIDRNFPHDYALNYAHGGRIHWAIDDARCVVLNAPVAWWTTKGHRPRYRYGRIGKETWDHYYVTLDGPRVVKLFRQCLSPARFRRPYAFIADPTTFCARWEKLFLALGRGGPVRESWAIHELEGIALQINQPAPLPDRSPLESKLDLLRNELSTDLSKKWDWEAEAIRLGLSLVHLRRSFRKLTGLPPHQFLLKARMELAADRLRTSREPIKEIAEAVGLPDIYHFSKQFKASFHLPPATYRNEMLGLYSSHPNQE